MSAETCGPAGLPARCSRTHMRGTLGGRVGRQRLAMMTAGNILLSFRNKAQEICEWGKVKFGKKAYRVRTAGLRVCPPVISLE